MKTYIWSYEATVPHSPKKLTGRIEAATGLEAKEAVMAKNELVTHVSVRILKNQDAARKQPFEAIKGVELA